MFMDGFRFFLLPLSVVYLLLESSRFVDMFFNDYCHIGFFQLIAVPFVFDEVNKY